MGYTFEASERTYKDAHTYEPGELITVEDGEPIGSHYRPTDAESLSYYKKVFPPGGDRKRTFSNLKIVEVIEKKLQTVVEEDSSGDKPRASDSPPVK
jgi:hypothetical protein